MHKTSARQIPFWELLSEETKQKILAESHRVKLGKNEMLFRMRDQVECLYIIEHGYAVLDRESDDHGIKSILLLHDGDILNEVILDYTTASVNCRALSDLQVIAVPKNAFRRLMELNFELSEATIHAMARKIRKMYRMVEGSTKTTRLDHQTASRIWKMTKDYGVYRNGYWELPFEVRVTFLAGYLGSNRETISRIVKKMSEENILSIDKGVCRVYDMDALLAYGKKDSNSR